MSKLKPKTFMPGPKKRSFGACFDIVCSTTGVRQPYHILAYEWPDDEVIRSVAERVALNWQSGYVAGFHWEPARADPPLTGALRGQAALAEAERITLDDPSESAGKRFLVRRDAQRRKRRGALAGMMGMPKDKRIKPIGEQIHDLHAAPRPQPIGPTDFDPENDRELHGDI